MTGWSTIRQAAEQPMAADRAAQADLHAQQERRLLDLLRRNAESRYGRDHGFATLRTVADYRRAVPIVRHEDLLAEIEAIADGITGVLTVEPVIAFEETSGSSTGRKLIPYTRAGLAAFEEAALIWLGRLLAAHPSIADGRAYWSISPAGRPRRHSSGGLPIGFASDAGYFSPTIGAALSAVAAVPMAAGSIADHETWQFFTLRALLDCDDLTFISVWSPTYLTLLLDALPRRADALLAAIHDGESGCSLPGGLDHGFHPRPERARSLASALAAPDPARIWPQLRLASAWSDGAARGAFQSLRARMQGIAFDGKGLMATEGFVSISDPTRRFPTPALTASFVEYIAEDGSAHLASTLEPGARYRIVITTESGLYRYDLGDEVACRGIADGVPELEFLGRADFTADLVGEKLGQAFVARCLETTGTTGILAPEEGRPSHYLLLLETEAAAPDPAALDRLLATSPHYAHARRLGQLGPVALRRCADLTPAYHRYRMRQGQRHGDIKPPALFVTPAETAAFLAFLATEARSETALRRTA